MKTPTKSSDTKASSSTNKADSVKKVAAVKEKKEVSFVLNSSFVASMELLRLRITSVFNQVSSLLGISEIKPVTADLTMLSDEDTSNIVESTNNELVRRHAYFKRLKEKGKEVAETVSQREVAMARSIINALRKDITLLLQTLEEVDGESKLSKGEADSFEVLQDFLKEVPEQYKDELKAFNVLSDFQSILCKEKAESFYTKLLNSARRYVKAEGEKDAVTEESAKSVIKELTKIFEIRNVTLNFGSPASTCKLPFFEGFIKGATSTGSKEKNSPNLSEIIAELLNKSAKPYLVSAYDEGAITVEAISDSMETSVRVMQHIPEVILFEGKVKGIESLLLPFFEGKTASETERLEEGILVISACQRGTAWSEAQKTSLITSILTSKGELNLPPLVLIPVLHILMQYNNTRTYLYLLADGRQRSTALYECMAGIIPAYISDKGEKIYFDNLPDEQQKYIKEYCFRTSTVTLNTVKPAFLPTITLFLDENTGLYSYNCPNDKEDYRKALRDGEEASSLVFIACNTTLKTPSAAQTTMAIAGVELQSCILAALGTPIGSCYLEYIIRSSHANLESVSVKIERMNSHVFFSKVVAVILEMYYFIDATKEFKEYYDSLSTSPRCIPITRKLLEKVSTEHLFLLRHSLTIAVTVLGRMVSQYNSETSEWKPKERKDKFPLVMPSKLSKGNKDRLNSFNINLVAYISIVAFNLLVKEDILVGDDEEDVLAVMYEALTGKTDVKSAFGVISTYLSRDIIVLVESNSDLVKKAVYGKAIDPQKVVSLEAAKGNSHSFYRLMNDLLKSE